MRSPRPHCSRAPPHHHTLFGPPLPTPRTARVSATLKPFLSQPQLRSSPLSMAFSLDFIPVSARSRTDPASPSPRPSPSPAAAVGFRRRGGGMPGAGRCRAMVQQTVQGASANYAKEMERLSAKESLLLAFKDSGGFEALVAGRTTGMQRIDVNERITTLERLNPTPRPTTCPFLEGQWNFEWFGAGSPGLFPARFLFERFPSTLANLLGMDIRIKEGYAKATANLKFLNSINSKFVLMTKLSVEGPLRMKEEYIEGVFETPYISEEAIPEQLKSAVGQAASTMQQLPAPIKDAVSNGLKIPLILQLSIGVEFSPYCKLGHEMIIEVAQNDSIFIFPIALWSPSFPSSPTLTLMPLLLQGWQFCFCCLCSGVAYVPMVVVV